VGAVQPGEAAPQDLGCVAVILYPLVRLIVTSSGRIGGAQVLAIGAAQPSF
jgi:hypothetical protein